MKGGLGGVVYTRTHESENVVKNICVPDKLGGSVGKLGGSLYTGNHESKNVVGRIECWRDVLGDELQQES